MFKEKTVFVIGAGASAEYGPGAFPIGSGLREQIAQMSQLARGAANSTAHDKLLSYHLKKKYSQAEIDARLEALQLIRTRIYLYNSIDAFIDRHHDNQHVAEIGKIQIGCAIAQAEAKSTLTAALLESENGLFKLGQMKDTWLEPFARQLFTGVREASNVGRDVTIICFNYDRCIEHYLMHAISQSYGVSFEEAHQIVEDMDIIHPYGTLGRLPGSARPGEYETPFGAAVTNETPIWSWAERLKTYTERVEEVETLKRIRSAIAYSHQLIFLGFGFTPENMTLLFSGEETKQPTRKLIYSTGKGISRQDALAVRHKIGRLFELDYGAIGGGSWRNEATIEHDVTCKQMFELYWQTFAR
ncbi:hypothetical protein ACIQUG_08090 [Ensifer sp. NPDC090286]|uniref:hypothetical protein n=1 Tax=Ensifer sp. NPDC090286 TaxID=3363991 RepID=UPI00383A569E